MSAVLAFLKKWGAAILSLLLALVGVGWVFKKKQEEIAHLKDQAAVDKALKNIEALHAVRVRVSAEEGETAGQIATIDQKLSENRRKIVEAHEGMENVPDDQVDETFSRLGY